MRYFSRVTMNVSWTEEALSTSNNECFWTVVSVERLESPLTAGSNLSILADHCDLKN